jgi:hypothetical protein
MQPDDLVRHLQSYIHRVYLAAVLISQHAGF